MISIFYWIITIVLSIVFKSWTLFIILAIFWILWMIFRGLAKNGIFSEDTSSWWLFDDFETSVDDTFDFGGGSFGGGGSDSSWGDSDGGGDGGD